MLLKLGILVLVGIIGGRVANYFKFPSVTGYIVFGLLVGPSFLNLVKHSDIDSLGIINDLTLAGIAFSIGNEFLLQDIKKVGKRIFIITAAEVIGALTIVFLLMYYVLNQSFEFSIIMASLSASTAPAGVVMVLRELRAEGPLTKTILPIVALDDAFGIMAFGISLSLVHMLSGTKKVSVAAMFLNPILEIVGSLKLALVMGAIMALVIKLAWNNDEILVMTICAILFTYGLANLLNLSPLLTCMALGGAFVNQKKNTQRMFKSISDFTPTINLFFYTVAGASLKLDVLHTVGIVGVVYILARGTGKYLGAAAGAAMVRSEPLITKYLGLGLLPQGGVSIGLSMLVKKELPHLSDSVVTIILFSVLIFEILGPITAKIAITKAGEDHSKESLKGGVESTT
ncbi:MAG: cation:proton antiporter [Clostridiaceae bacterium]|nr:cation:proton antiporter [Clostridiaceae bacterium]